MAERMTHAEEQLKLSDMARRECSCGDDYDCERCDWLDRFGFRWHESNGDKHCAILVAENVDLRTQLAALEAQAKEDEALAFAHGREYREGCPLCDRLKARKREGGEG